MSDEFLIGLGNDRGRRIRESAAADPVSFWEAEARRLDWFAPWDTALEWNPPFARWFAGGGINASHNALDVHLEQRGSKPAILWEGENGDSRMLTYRDMWAQVQRLANALRSLGLKKGDRLAIYLPMIPELPIAMLACARIGVIHTVVFSGFSAAALRERIVDSGSTVVITADGGYRRGDVVELKEIVDEAVGPLDSVRRVVVVRRAGNRIRTGTRDVYWDDLVAAAPDRCPAEPLDGTHPLYILYTSGTTGRPKGVLHGTGGYLTHVHSTFRWAFDIRDSDVYFCTADIGWVTGHSYVVYAPLLCGATQVIYEGAPDHPAVSRMWEIIQKYRVTIFYTTPTALRMFMRFGDGIPASYDLSSLRLLGTVGEPINPGVWRWYYKTIGRERCPVIDTWWQTETGGMVISALPGIETIPLRPGSAARPVPGMDVAVVDESGGEVEPGTRGHLVIRGRWPGMMMGLWGDDEKYRRTYWSKYEGWYYPGDYAMRDKDGYLWVLGRADDVLKVAGHRIGTAELESGIVSHPDVAESAVCGVDDAVKGQAIAAFVVLRQGVDRNPDALRAEIVSKIRDGVGPIATPKRIYLVPRLPKTRSGKIMRRMLRAIAGGDDNVGDTTTLEDGAAVDEIRAAVADAERGENAR